MTADTKVSVKCHPTSTTINLEKGTLSVRHAAGVAEHYELVITTANLRVQEQGTYYYVFRISDVSALLCVDGKLIAFNPQQVNAKLSAQQLAYATSDDPMHVISVPVELHKVQVQAKPLPKQVLWWYKDNPVAVEAELQKDFAQVLEDDYHIPPEAAQAIQRVMDIQIRVKPEVTTPSKADCLAELSHWPPDRYVDLSKTKRFNLEITPHKLTSGCDLFVILTAEIRATVFTTDLGWHQVAQVALSPESKVEFSFSGLLSFLLDLGSHLTMRVLGIVGIPLLSLLIYLLRNHPHIVSVLAALQKLFKEEGKTEGPSSETDEELASNASDDAKGRGVKRKTAKA